MANNSYSDARYKRSKYMRDAVLDKVTSLGVAPTQLVANLARAGQLGTGIRFTKLDGATPAVFNPVVGVVLQVPSMWDRWPRLQDMLRAIMETHAKSITGIDFGYKLETQDTLVGHDSQTMMVPTRTTRGSVNPSATFQEYPGMPIYNLFRTWMFDIQHPDTNMSILPAQIEAVNEIPAWFMTAYSMSMLFIQYDPSGLPDRIYDAMVICNMFPTDIGDIGFERTIGTTQLKERSVSFTGLVQHNENTRELGYRVAELLQLHKINYNFALPGVAGTTTVDEAIESNIRTYGGLEYEAGPDKATNHSAFGPNVDGSIDQFQFLGTGSQSDIDSAYDDLNNPSETMEATGAAVASRSTVSGHVITADRENATSSGTGGGTSIL